MDRESRVVAEVQVPALGKSGWKHPDQLKAFVEERVKQLQSYIRPYIRQCEDDIDRFERSLSTLVPAKIFSCSWTEYDSDAGKYINNERFFLHQYQAQSCQATKINADIEIVEVFFDTWDQKYYRIVENQKQSLYVEMTPQDEAQRRKQIEIANLKLRLSELEKNNK